TTTVEIDGAAVPVADAAAHVRQGIALTSDAVDTVHQALAQPLGQALADTKSYCDNVKRRLRKYLTAVHQPTSDPISDVTSTLGSTIGQALEQTGQFTSQVGSAAATGGMGLPPVPPVPSVPSSFPGASAQPPVLPATATLLAAGVSGIPGPAPVP